MAIFLEGWIHQDLYSVKGESIVLILKLSVSKTRFSNYFRRPDGRIDANDARYVTTMKSDSVYYLIPYYNP
jgi:hypothetical protein